MTKQYTRDNDIIETSEYKKFLKKVRPFFMKCAKYLQTSMPVLKNHFIKSLTLPHLRERHQATLDELMQGFARIMTDMNALESEFLEYQATSDDEFPAYFDKDDKPIRIDYIDHQISKQIDLYSGQLHFKHLAEFVKFLLLILHSNSYCDSIFSTTREPERSALMIAIT